MQELYSTSKRQKRKKLSARIDLTPMVDLGFLLISFFIFITSISQPTLMKLWLPADAKDKDRQLVRLSAVFTILLGKNDKLYYYERDDPSSSVQSDYKGIRNIILDKKRRTDPIYF